MKLVYKILWIDNETIFFKNHEDLIIEHLKSKGLICEVIKYTSIGEFNP